MNDRHVLVLGLGQSGLAMARWCARHGATVTVADTREAPPQLAALHESVPQARFVAGPLSAALVDDASLRAVYRSPGLSPAAIAAVVDEARRRGLSARLADVASYDEAGGKAIAAARHAAEALPGDGWLQRLNENAASGPLEELLAAVRACVYARDESGGQDAGYGLETEAAQLDDATNVRQGPPSGSERETCA